jgi:TetR/AcrR family transcriptional regulator, transcriptional repressor for nem operon
MKPESESKRKLLEAAIDLIWKSSYGAVSVDDICGKAGVNKGSFYYAFKSKSDLAVAAYERYWENKRAKMDSIFSPQVPPLLRLDNFIEAIIADQMGRYKEYGKMAGCPFCSIGSELGTQDENIRIAADRIGAKMGKYNESLVRDLAAEGLIESSNHAELAQEVGAYLTGVLMQAKIENSPKHLDRLKHGVLRLLGIKAQPAAV